MLFIHNPRMRPIIRLFIIGAVVFLITRPYNLICNAFNKCSPIYFSDILDYLPNNYPDYKASILVETENEMKDLQFEAVETVKEVIINGRTSEFEYLIKKGVQNKLYFKGMGSEQPIADNKTDEGKSKNRRVEFQIIKK